jgi:hypothetical protein
VLSFGAIGNSKIPLLPVIVFFVALLALPFQVAAQPWRQLQQSGAQSQQPPPQQPQPQAPQTPPQPGAPQRAAYDPAIFLSPVPSDQLAFLKDFEGKTSGDAAEDKQFRKLLHTVVPDCMFHYGHDMPLLEALEIVLKTSPQPVEIGDGRYVLVSGRSGPYLAGRGFMWMDTQAGIALGGFYFHPTNGEPTPTLTIFSKQVKEDSLEMGQLPPFFAADLSQWSAENRVPVVLTRYFITGRKERILLAHDEDYCAPTEGTSLPDQTDCQQMNADAADIDMNAAYYLEQINYATNGTAWMIEGPEQVAWIQLRENTCGVGPDPLACRIRLTREHTRVIVHRRHEPHPEPAPRPRE